MVSEFLNEPLTDFRNEFERISFYKALDQATLEAGHIWPVKIGGSEITTSQLILSRNPAEKSQIIGKVWKAGIQETDRAVEIAKSAYEDWSRFPAQERARILLKAASIMRQRKHLLSATMVLEIGKTWAEADGDTAEAIDFCEYYAREMMRLSQGVNLPRVANTDNEMVYEPLGVGVIIPPWNFPCAILTGMTAAAVVTGNTVILKPASLTPVTGARVMQVFEDAGVPGGVINFLPGDGSKIGNYLVTRTDIRFVNFTGSKEVGCQIYQEAAKVRPGQKFLKRVIAEMGGKDAILVDDSWDEIEKAATDTVSSAYGFQGQKCSACSRLIITQQPYEKLSERVMEIASGYKVGDPIDPDTQVGPVADKSQFDRIIRYIRSGEEEARLILGGKADDKNGYFIEPTIFADVDEYSHIAQEEIFGPVLSIIPACDFGHAIQIANSTIYGLTGSVYAKDRQKLHEARKRFHTGNLYINRKCTGARVGVEPFGGFNMSGTCSRAGGPNYLELFMQTKVISEAI